MADILNLDVLAEGVVKRSQLDFYEEGHATTVLSFIWRQRRLDQSLVPTGVEEIED
ncbi:MAG: hypothetical protein IBX47_05245 [Desulfuromonadales bacterium]|nr:hypothetical protein [Desulfuromonadales bacterium]